MPQDSLHKRLGGGKDLYSDRERELLAVVQGSSLDAGIRHCRDAWSIQTSKSSLSEWRRAFEAHNAEQAAMDKLTRRRDRTRKLSAAVQDGAQSLSPENLELIDQRLFELQTALDRFDDLHGDELAEQADCGLSDDEKKRMLARQVKLVAARAELESRLAFFTGIFVKLSMSADMGARTKLAVEKFREAQRKAQDRALDALFEEIKGNNEAETLFRRFRDAVNKASEVAA